MFFRGIFPIFAAMMEEKKKPNKKTATGESSEEKEHKKNWRRIRARSLAYESSQDDIQITDDTDVF